MNNVFKKYNIITGIDIMGIQFLNPSFSIKEKVPPEAMKVISFPEHGLHPLAQEIQIKSLIEKHKPLDTSIMVLTHSPYVINTLNNLIIADGISEQDIIPENQTIPFSEVTAWELVDDQMISILDEEYELIATDNLDSVAKKISDEFSKLIHLKNEEDVNTWGLR